MAFGRKILLAGLMWLTAAMTLVAGFPHFECRCPDGHFKPFCLGFCSATSGCCGESCCRVHGSAVARRQPVAEHKPCCCCHQENRDRARPAHGFSQVKQPGCVKKVAPFKTWTPSHDKAKVARDQTVQVLDLPCPSGMTDTAQTMGERTSWEIRLLGPPTDLVTLLQHFLI